MEYNNQGMSIKRIKITNWDNAIFGMRLPMNSEDQSDSQVFPGFILGPKDKDLMIRLANAGNDHSKVLRMIHVSALVKMPFSWWAHYDTYKVATTAISRSRMHKLTSRVLTKDDFFTEEWTDFSQTVLDEINRNILQAQMINKNKNPEQATYYWRKALDSLPVTYTQERMIDLNYQTLLGILGSRYKVEKLSSEWNFFCEAFLSQCPHLNDLYKACKSKRSLTTEEFKVLK